MNNWCIPLVYVCNKLFLKQRNEQQHNLPFWLQRLKQYTRHCWREWKPKIIVWVLAFWVLISTYLFTQRRTKTWPYLYTWWQSHMMLLWFFNHNKIIESAAKVWREIPFLIKVVIAVRSWLIYDSSRLVLPYDYDG